MKTCEIISFLCCVFLLVNYTQANIKLARSKQGAVVSRSYSPGPWNNPSKISGYDLKMQVKNGVALIWLEEAFKKKITKLLSYLLQFTSKDPNLSYLPPHGTYPPYPPNMGYPSNHPSASNLMHLPPGNQQSPSHIPTVPPMNKPPSHYPQPVYGPPTGYPDHRPQGPWVYPSSVSQINPSATYPHHMHTMPSNPNSGNTGMLIDIKPDPVTPQQMTSSLISPGTSMPIGTKPPPQQQMNTMSGNIFTYPNPNPAMHSTPGNYPKPNPMTSNIFTYPNPNPAMNPMPGNNPKPNPMTSNIFTYHNPNPAMNPMTGNNPNSMSGNIFTYPNPNPAMNPIPGNTFPTMNPMTGNIFNYPKPSSGSQQMNTVPGEIVSSPNPIPVMNPVSGNIFSYPKPNPATQQMNTAPADIFTHPNPSPVSQPMNTVSTGIFSYPIATAKPPSTFTQIKPNPEPSGTFTQTNPNPMNQQQMNAVPGVTFSYPSSQNTFTINNHNPMTQQQMNLQSGSIFGIPHPSTESQTTFTEIKPNPVTQQQMNTVPSIFAYPNQSPHTFTENKANMATQGNIFSYPKPNPETQSTLTEIKPNSVMTQQMNTQSVPANIYFMNPATGQPGTTMYPIVSNPLPGSDMINPSSMQHRPNSMMQQQMNAVPGDIFSNPTHNPATPETFTEIKPNPVSQQQPNTIPAYMFGPKPSQMKPSNMESNQNTMAPNQMPGPFLSVPSHSAPVFRINNRSPDTTSLFSEHQMKSSKEQFAEPPSINNFESPWSQEHTYHDIYNLPNGYHNENAETNGLQSVETEESFPNGIGGDFSNINSFDTQPENDEYNPNLLDDNSWNLPLY